MAVRLSPYLVALPELHDRIASAAGEPPIRLESQRAESAAFIEALRRFDQLVYAPLGMSMPKWVLYDCAVVPGLAFGLSAPAAELPSLAKTLGFANDYAGPVPVSLLIAIPTLDTANWLIYEVVAADEAAIPDARAKTLRAAIELIGAETITATAQWRSCELDVHAAFAPLELLAAWLPAHDRPATAVFQYHPRSAQPSTAATETLEVTKNDALERLQTRLEDGSSIIITGPAVDGTIGLRESEAER